MMTDALIEQAIAHLMAPDCEGAVGWMYLDSGAPPVLTCGAGHVLTSQAQALLLPWREPDGAPSETAQVARDYQAVLAAEPGHMAAHYEPLTVCRLSAEDIANLCHLDLVSKLARLRVHFPSLDFYPNAVLSALADMAFNLGGDFPPKWPAFTAAVLAMNWSEAAVQSHRRQVSATRNAYVHDLFLSALQPSAV